jgi:hypothetical protein
MGGRGDLDGAVLDGQPCDGLVPCVHDAQPDDGQHSDRTEDADERVPGMRRDAMEREGRGREMGWYQMVRDGMRFGEGGATHVRPEVMEGDGMR